MSVAYPYGAKHLCTVEMDVSCCEVDGEIIPSEDYSKEEWEKLSEEQQAAIAFDLAKDILMEHISFYVHTKEE